MLTCCGALWLAGPAAAQTADGGDESLGPEDRLEAYLLDRGMLELLVLHLEQRVSSEARSRDRTAVAERLAGVYASLLSASDSVEEQRRWESAGERLLQEVPEADTTELRLSLARAAYTRIEKVAERYALRMISEAERVEAVQRLDDLRGRFATIGAEADRRVRELEREEERSSRVDSEWLREALAQARRQRSMAYYLAGWSSYYLAELSPNATEAATAAIQHFGWLLGADRNSEPRLTDVPLQSLQYEHIARAALATAASFALQGRSAAAEQWLEAIESFDGVPDSVREQLFVRRMTVAAGSGDWARTAELVSAARGTAPMSQSGSDGRDGNPLPVGEARLLAVLAFEEIARAADSAYLDWRVLRLRDIALGDLVVRDQLGHVLDLAGRYSTERFGDSSFISLHVRGLKLYQEARDRHESSGEPADEPTRDSGLARTYREAADLLGHSLRAEDSDGFIAARANTRMLIGLAGYYAGTIGSDDEDSSLLGAADALVQAADEFTDKQRSADALWMAIRALDAEIEGTEGTDSESATTARRDELVARFLREHPEDQKAAALVLRLAESENIPAEQRIELLLGVPESNPLREAALRSASRLAYNLYRDSDEQERDFAATRFAEISEPLLVVEQRRAFAGDRAAQRTAVARARQLAEAMLSMRVPDLVRAERAIALLERMLIEGFEGAEEAESEIEFRRAQLALASGRPEEAERIIEGLRDSGDDFGRSSVRLFYRDAVIEFQRLDRPNADEDQLVEAAQRLVRVGQDLLDQITDAPAGETQENSDLVVGVRIRVAQAAQRVWEIRAERSALTVAVSQFRSALEIEPRNSEALRGVAVLGSRSGDDEASLDAWRVLLSGHRPGSDEWFEARASHLVVLARLDPERARAVLRQHVVLYPDLGPEPHGGVLRELASQLGVPLGSEDADG